MGGSSKASTSQSTVTKSKTITDAYKKTKTVNKDSHDVTTKNILNIKLGKKAKITGTDALSLLGGTSQALAASSAPATVVASMPESVAGQPVGDAALGLGLGDALKWGGIAAAVIAGIWLLTWLIKKR